MKRTSYLGTLVTIFTEVLLPLATALLPLGKILELFMEGHPRCGGGGGALFLLPTFLMLVFYVENLFHREEKALELGLITVLGPLLRWAASFKLFFLRHGKLGQNTEMEDLEIFISATKMIDGIFQPSVQMIFMVYLMAVGVKSADKFTFTQMFSLTKEIRDFSGNVIKFPELSNLNLYTSTAVLVKNISQLWMANFPRRTTEDGSETIVTPDPDLRPTRKFLQWLVLVMFVTTVVTYRLLSYVILCLHFNYFHLPAVSTIVLGFLFHLVLRGMGDQFFVNTSKTDVFLTACCCSLVPTPTSANIRAHNLLQVHTVFTNLVMFLGLGLCIFLNIDYYLPIIARPALQYSHKFFFYACLVVIVLLPISLLFYFTFKKVMPHTGQRKTFFWTNKGPSLWGKVTGVVSFILVVFLISLTALGLDYSEPCAPPSDYDVPSSRIGFSVQCNSSHSGENSLS